jgi:cytochrome c6
MLLKKVNSLIIIIFLMTTTKVDAIDLNKGKILFTNNCNVCHKNGENVIIPEKNLKKEALEENGMNSIDAIIYQVLNGKNGMPAFGGRLSQKDIEEIATYVLKESTLNFNK